MERYREIECVASEMLAAGRAGDWTRVGALGTTIRSLADGVARAGGPEALDPGQQRERLQIMKRLIVLDGELRRLSDPTSGWLDAMFGTAPSDDAAPRDGAAPHSA